MKNRWRKALCAVLWVALCGCAQIGLAQQTLRTPPDPTVDIRHIKLELDVSLKQRRVAGHAIIDFVPRRAIRVVRLDAVNHDVRSVQARPLGDQPAASLEFAYTGKTLELEFGRELAAGEPWRVDVAYAVEDPQAGLYFFGPSDQEPNVPWMVWSQGEPQDNRYWFPCIDHPIEKQTTELIATVDGDFEVLSNGRLVSREALPDGRRRFHWLQEKPHVAYLVTLVAGEFVVHEQRWRDRPVLYYVPRGREADVARTFGRTPAMLEFFSRRFGVAYPWDKYAQVVVEQFVVGGMENTSATTLYEGVLHDERALLDSSPDWLIAHELGHQWWGDLVTCRDWAHLWLNEGFATYCEVLWAEHHQGRDERDYRLWEKLNAARTGTAESRPILDRFYAHPQKMFDNRAYPKAGWVLHMLRQRLGDAAFFGGLQQYARRFALKTAETSDLRKTLEQVSGLSLERFFYDWVEQPGHPVLEVTSSYSVKDKLLRVELKQTQKRAAFELPVRIDVPLEGGGTHRLCHVMSGKQDVLYVPLPRRPQAIRVDPEFSILCEIRENKVRDWWVWQIRQAPTVPERLRAVQHFEKSRAVADVRLLRDVLQSDPFWGLRAAAARALGTTRQPAARDALLQARAQPDARVRRAAVQALKSFKRDSKVAEALQEYWKSDEPSYAVRAAILETLVEVSQKVEAQPYLDALGISSHREVIRRAALRALGRDSEPETLAVLRQWLQPGKPRDCRIAAAEALAERHRRQTLPPAETAATVQALLEVLPGAGPRLRRGIVAALGRMGKLAEDALPPLRRLAVADASPQVRDAAEAAIASIERDDPLQKRVDELNRRVQELERRNEELKSELSKLKQIAP